LKENEFQDPLVETITWKHPGSCNKIRSMPQNPNVISSWSDLGTVYIWNCKFHFKALNQLPLKKEFRSKILYKFEGHKKEGYAMDWHPKKTGILLTGDCYKNIYLWHPKENNWLVEAIPFKGHTNSVEDIKWSPNEKNVFASCSADKSIRIWDIRSKKRKSCLSVRAHNQDVNVVSWNAINDCLMVSGSDDCSFKVWDIRKFDRINPRPIAHFTWCEGAITSIEFHPFQSSTLIVGQENNQVTFWDISLEKEEKIFGNSKSEDVRIPPQLLFIHQGQNEIKEVQWHPQISSLCVSTAVQSIDLFQPGNIQE